jgi:hypothetical protein
MLLEGLQLGCGCMFLHDLVSVFRATLASWSKTLGPLRPPKAATRATTVSQNLHKHWMTSWVSWVTSWAFLLVFYSIKVKYEVHFILTINHNYKCCSNQDHMKKHHAQEQKIYPGKPFSNKGENPSKILCYTLQEKDLFTTKNILAHKMVLPS